MTYEDKIKSIAQEVESIFAYDGKVNPDLVIDVFYEKLLDNFELKMSYEKQIPKKPAYAFIDGFTLSVPYNCPVCGEQIAKYDAYARCVLKEHHCKCGQAIDWSEVE